MQRLAITAWAFHENKGDQTLVTYIAHPESGR